MPNQGEPKIHRQPPKGRLEADLPGSAVVANSPTCDWPAQGRGSRARCASNSPRRRAAASKCAGGGRALHTADLQQPHLATTSGSTSLSPRPTASEYGNSRHPSPGTSALVGLLFRSGPTGYSERGKLTGETRLRRCLPFAMSLEAATLDRDYRRARRQSRHSSAPIYAARDARLRRHPLAACYGRHASQTVKAAPCTATSS